jgi:hypothetical protein
MGFSTSFGSFRHSKTKQDYWKEYGGKWCQYMNLDVRIAVR